MKNLIDKRSYSGLIRFTSVLYVLCFHAMDAQAQNKAEKKFMSYSRDSVLVLNSKDYFRQLKKDGLSAQDARYKTDNLQMEVDSRNRAKKVLPPADEKKKKSSPEEGGKKLPGFSPPALMMASVPNYCWRDDLAGYPGEEVCETCSCACTVPISTAATCPNNIGFEDGSFNGWLGRIGTYHTGADDDCDFALVFDGTPVFQGPVGIEPARHLMVTKGGYDPRCGFPLVEPGSSNNYAIRLGNAMNGGKAEQLVYKLRATTANHYLNYKYAVVLEDPGDDHDACHRPSFSVELYKNSECDETAQRIACGSFIVKYANDLPGFYHFGGGVYKPWTNVIVDLEPYMTGSTEDFYIKFTTTDCAWGGHFGYAYVDGACTDEGVPYNGLGCLGSPIQFFAPGVRDIATSYEWKVDGVTVADEDENELTYYFDNTSSHYVESIITTDNPSCSPLTYRTNIAVEACHAMYLECEDDCVESFAPDRGRKYVLSAWVKESTNPFPETYSLAEVGLRFIIPHCSTCTTLDCNPALEGGGLFQCEYHFMAKGIIIDGWQRIEEVFTIPEDAMSMYIELISPGGDPTSYFDDIRIFPFDGSMKSYVYDPVSQKLLAELDENNYATFYEYDQEGNLVRVKKETERGIKTIKESMSNTSVKP